ncbi:MAG: peptidylprolyl isomerase [Planctomycetota bacterium]|jgi:parvulin-like peptidyl-prolyl isomerase
MAFVVNGEKIEDSAIKHEVERLRPDYERVFADQDPAEREAQLLDWSKENVIERVLINQEAKSKGDEIPTSKIEETLAKLKEQYEDPKQLYKDLNAEDDEKIKRDIETQMRVEQTLNEVCERMAKPSKADIRKYYEQNKDQFRTPERIRVAHIVKHVNWQTDEESAYRAISEAHKELAEGAAFEMIVDKYTDCADNGGDLGFIVKGQMVEEFEDVVFNLGIGQSSDIFRTRFGFHIAKVYAREPEGVASLEDVKDRITETLQEQIREKAIDDFVDDLRGKAKIEEV